MFTSRLPRYIPVCFVGVSMFRRLFFGAAAALVLVLTAVTSGCALAPPTLAEFPPIVFVHGNGESAASWQTTVWRFESNGWPRDRLFALQQTYPLARDDDTKAQPGRSSSAEQMAFIKKEVESALLKTGAKQVVLMGHASGGLAVRNYIQNGGGDQTVSHAILGGTPIHGQFILNAPKNATGSEVTGPVKWLTIRSDANDKFAQPATGGYDSPAIKGAQNVVIAGIDHRETSYSPEAFAAAFHFITGRTQPSLILSLTQRIVLGGLVTGLGVNSEDRASPNNYFPNNLPIRKSRVEVYAVHPETGLRLGSPVHEQSIGPDGRWGPFNALSDANYEFVVSAPGYAKTHIYRSPFARSSNLVHLQADRIQDVELPAFSIIHLIRPRGYLDPNHHHIEFDKLSPPPGVPLAPLATLDSSKILLPKLQFRAITAEFHTETVERVVGWTWPAKDSHVVRLELTQ